LLKKGVIMYLVGDGGSCGIWVVVSGSKSRLEKGA
jgi:hypothetical protein